MVVEIELEVSLRQSPLKVVVETGQAMPQDCGCTEQQRQSRPEEEDQLGATRMPWWVASAPGIRGRRFVVSIPL